ncbi:hypothetical protein Dsin_029053 [Dipteronia sinensis]|uniref:PGG domain-containing protein n=1 Tax=Dipteronia sinensis TaxID=43782 RepID=A0AAE0DW51_9ROSI|nr:hypothetical protein Dsin_029053 [Dipteronia sinensis]
MNIYLHQEILALSEDTNVEPYTLDVILVLGKKYEECLSQIKGAKESHLVAYAHIATVTFAAAFTLPGGYKSEEEPAKMTRDPPT